MSLEKPELPGGPMSGLVAQAVEYMVDAGQRSVLFFDIMRQRGDQYREHVAQTAPHVLSYAAELIIDGRKLEQPVNYVLVRILPPKGVEIDLKRRQAFVVNMLSTWDIRAFKKLFHQGHRGLAQDEGLLFDVDLS